jgi:hypothetical protein
MMAMPKQDVTQAEVSKQSRATQEVAYFSHEAPEDHGVVGHHHYGYVRGTG